MVWSISRPISSMRRILRLKRRFHKFTECLRLAEKIRAVLDEGGGGRTESNGDATVATRPKDGKEGGEDGEDPEQAKRGLGLD